MPRKCCEIAWYGGLLATLVLASAACSGSVAAGCSENSDCDPGFICVPPRCEEVCFTQKDCTGPEVCIGNICDTPVPGVTPQIDSVTGNAPNDATRIADGLLVSGTALADAHFELTDSGGQAAVLAVRSQNATSAHLVLPSDVTSGEYVLVAWNASGSSDQEPVTLTLPELDGDELLHRLNEDATGQLALERIPTGGSANTVALGDHLHDAAYYPRDEADALFVTAADAAPGGGSYVPNGDFARGLYRWQAELGGPGTAVTERDVSADGIAGAVALENPVATRVLLTSEERIVVDRSATYRLAGSFRDVTESTVAVGTISLGLRLYDGGGTELVQPDDTWWICAAREVEPGDSWTRYQAEIGAGTALEFPPEARFMNVAVLLNGVEGGFAGNRQFQVQGVGLFDEAQPVLAHACPAGQQITEIAADGTVTCASPFIDFDRTERKEVCVDTDVYVVMSSDATTNTTTVSARIVAGGGCAGPTVAFYTVDWDTIPVGVDVYARLVCYDTTGSPYVASGELSLTPGATLDQSIGNCDPSTGGRLHDLSMSIRSVSDNDAALIVH
jgi:hypothetical protein